MNKKYLSALLFGAVMIASTGTFTSCKDYDDDIQNLQEQINAQKSTLEDKVAAVETTIKTLQDAQASLEQAIADAESAALKAAQEAHNIEINRSHAFGPRPINMEYLINTSTGKMSAYLDMVANDTTLSESINNLASNKPVMDYFKQKKELHFGNSFFV